MLCYGLMIFCNRNNLSLSCKGTPYKFSATSYNWGKDPQHEVVVQDGVDDGVDRQEDDGEERVPGGGVYHLPEVEETDRHKRHPGDKVSQDDETDFYLELVVSFSKLLVGGHPWGWSSGFEEDD